MREQNLKRISLLTLSLRFVLQIQQNQNLYRKAVARKLQIGFLKTKELRKEASIFYEGTIFEMNCLKNFEVKAL